ncbi:MAG: class II aldolase/adducin family protein [Candidatus Rokubacteria bacterium]|nr:class II aldolase/adducin family protein [Candidatus Rokubacteria bacterium]
MGVRQMTHSDLCRQIIEIGISLLEADLATDTAGNISARCPDRENILITPSRRDYRLLGERDLVRVQLSSGRAEGRWKPSSEWRLHAAVYQVRPDVNAIIHHHAVWASAVAVARKSIPVLIDEAADIGPIPTAPYAPSASQELAEIAAAELARGSNAVLLANHGAVAVGRDLPEAFQRGMQVERLAQIYLGATILGGAHPLDGAAVARSREFFATYRATRAEWRGLPRVMPRITGHVALQDLVSYGFRAGVTFASLLHALILQRIQR